VLELSQLVLLGYVLLVVPSQYFFRLGDFFIHSLCLLLHLRQLFFEIINLVLVLMLSRQIFDVFLLVVFDSE
jgi:hypothetical protein